MDLFFCWKFQFKIDPISGMCKSRGKVFIMIAIPIFAIISIVNVFSSCSWILYTCVHVGDLLTRIFFSFLQGSTVNMNTMKRIYALISQFVKGYVCLGISLFIGKCWLSMKHDSVEVIRDVSYCSFSVIDLLVAN